MALMTRIRKKAELGTAKVELRNGMSKAVLSHSSSPKIFATQQENARLFYGFGRRRDGKRAKRSFAGMRYEAELRNEVR